MTKRKTTAQKQKTVRLPPKLDTVFDCPFCNHNKAVEVHFHKGKATIS